MIAPFYKYGAFGDEASLVVAFVIGLGFGFFLERAGLGSARKLTAQFYLTDLAVFKVMFSAIVTAMLGIFYLAWIGWLDLSLVYLGSTYLVPQIVGGLVLGVGFIIGGYCPGTSVVGLSTGKVDAFIFLLGLTLGILAFGEAYPMIEGFVNATDKGVLTIPEAFHVPYGLVAFAVVLMALVGFWAAGLIEKRFGGQPVEAQP